MNSGALSLLLLLAAASCTAAGCTSTAIGETRWAAREAPGAPGARSQGTATTEPGFAGEHPTLGFFQDDDARAALEEGRTAGKLPAALEPVEPKARKMIYSATLQVRVSSIEEAVQRLLRRVEELEGYLARRNNDTLTCRIPAGSFRTLVEEVKGYGIVLQEALQARDVTKQHMDLSIRLENAESARQRLLKLLEKATKVEDILKIEEQLTRLTETIERIKGELKYLNEQIAYSLVTVGFHAASPSTTPPKRSRSRFDWINQVGIEQVLRRF